VPEPSPDFPPDASGNGVHPSGAEQESEHVSSEEVRQ
jgi:hypothetical protein